MKGFNVNIVYSKKQGGYLDEEKTYSIKDVERELLNAY